MGDRDVMAPDEVVETEPIEVVEERARQAAALEDLVRLFERQGTVTAAAFEKCRRAFATKAQTKPARLIADLTGPAVERCRARQAGDELPVPTPFATWTEALAGGLWPGVHFLVGATGVGKTVLTTQLAFHAAEQGHAVGIAPIELGAEQTTIRMLGETAGVFWSRLMTGSASDGDIAKLADARQRLDRLPIIVDDHQPNGWPPSRLKALCSQVAELAEQQAKPGEPRRYPLVIVDFAQIMGSEPSERLDVRERIARAAYEARQHSQDHGCAVLMVSSVARNGYGITGGNRKALQEKGVRFRADRAGGEFAGYVLEGRDALVGLGKESGELEYSATSVNVMVRAPEGSGIALAIPKVRLGRETWVPLVFEGARYTEPTEAEGARIAAVFEGEDTTASSQGRGDGGSGGRSRNAFSDRAG